MPPLDEVVLLISRPDGVLVNLLRVSRGVVGSRAGFGVRRPLALLRRLATPDETVSLGRLGDGIGLGVSGGSGGAMQGPRVDQEGRRIKGGLHTT